MNDRVKKEIEAKWQKLLAGSDTKPSTKPTDIPLGAKVIRRRKGQKDAPITSDSK